MPTASDWHMIRRNGESQRILVTRRSWEKRMIFQKACMTRKRFAYILAALVIILAAFAAGVNAHEHYVGDVDENFATTRWD